MTFVAGQRIGIIDGQDLLVFIGDDDHFGARFKALLRAFSRRGVCALGAALRIRNVSLDGRILRKGNAYIHERHREHRTNQQELLHKQDVSLIKRPGPQFTNVLHLLS